MELTKEERAKVFALYLGVNMISEDLMSPKRGSLITVVIGGAVQSTCNSEDDFSSIEKTKLLLTPLDKITEEHLAEVTTLYKSVKINGETPTDFERGMTAGGAIIQRLISYGYAVPLDFGYKHPANGKTAIQLGIAIEK